METNKEKLEQIKARIAELPEKQGALLADLVKRISDYADYAETLESLSDKEIGDLLITGIWGELPMFSPKSALLEEAISRLKREKGKEKDNGNKANRST